MAHISTAPPGVDILPDTATLAGPQYHAVFYAEFFSQSEKGGVYVFLLPAIKSFKRITHRLSDCSAVSASVFIFLVRIKRDIILGQSVKKIQLFRYFA